MRWRTRNCGWRPSPRQLRAARHAQSDVRRCGRWWATATAIRSPTWSPRSGSGDQGESRKARSTAARALETITTKPVSARQLRRPGRRPMKRVPVVLADALVRAAQMRYDADERARRNTVGRAPRDEVVSSLYVDCAPTRDWSPYGSLAASRQLSDAHSGGVTRCVCGPGRRRAYTHAARQWAPRLFGSLACRSAESEWRLV